MKKLLSLLLLSINIMNPKYITESNNQTENLHPITNSKNDITQSEHLADQINNSIKLMNIYINDSPSEILITQQIAEILNNKDLKPYLKTFIDIRNHAGVTPLYYAAYHGHTNIVKLLIDNHANINIAINDGSMPLHIAAQNGYTDIVKLLINNGADINKAMNNGARPLFIATKNGHTDVATLLLAAEAQNSYLQSIRKALQNTRAYLHSL